jgi:hypothetical protein
MRMEPKYGDPNGKKDTANPIRTIWPKYNKVANEHLEFTDKIRVGSGIDKRSEPLVREANRWSPEGAKDIDIKVFRPFRALLNEKSYQG